MNTNIVDDILNDNTDYRKAFDDYNKALENHDKKNADRQQVVLDAYFKKYNEINRKFQSDIKLNTKTDIDRTQTAIGKLAAQNPNFIKINPLYKSDDIEYKKQLVVAKLDNLLSIYPDYNAVYNYLTSEEGQLEIEKNPKKLDEIVGKINTFLLQFPLTQSPDKFQNTPIYDLTLKQVYKNTIQTAIDIINDVSIILSRRESLTNVQLRRTIFKTLTEESRRMYVGIWLIFFSFVLYFIDSAA